MFQLRRQEPEFANEAAVVIALIRPAATFSHPMGEGNFLTGWGRVEFLVGPKIRHKLFTLCKGCIKPGWHGFECAPELWRRQCPTSKGSVLICFFGHF